MNWSRVRTVTRFDLIQLLKARDFWVPMAILGGIFFVVFPLLAIGALNVTENSGTAVRISETLDLLPQQAQDQIASQVPEGTSPSTRASYALAVFLFAPLAVIVPITISTAVGASTLVGERERGTGEFLAHSPVAAREIFLGKLLASLIPGYVTTLVGFGLYAIIVNSLIGPELGGWFFPTREWWLLMLWIVPPFLMITLSIVLRLSARVKSTAAAQQASGLVNLPLILVAYGQATGTLFSGSLAAAVFVGFLAWLGGFYALARGMQNVTRARLLGVADFV